MHGLVHWEYDGAAGPEHWGHLSPDFAACASGHSQSPIDLVQARRETLSDMELDYRSSNLHIVNNGHTIQANYEPGSSITLDGVRYELIQFHFHHPSEHLVDGRAFALEVHLVHRSDAGEYAVVGVLVDEGERPNAALQRVLDRLPATVGGEEVRVANALEILPQTRTYYSYQGSLTTPPCSEGVRWLVLAAPVQVSRAEVQALGALYPRSARPVQPLHERPLRVGGSSR